MRKTSSRHRRWLILAGLLLGGAVLTYVVVLPVARDTGSSPNESLSEIRARPIVTSFVLPVREQIRLRAMQVFYSLWFFAIGASFGSFVNVVAFRWPRGRSILGNSHCPNCNIGIRLRDNIPVLSWFLLSGRCGTCRLSISPRYVIAECVAGGMFLMLLYRELLSGAANLPGEIPGHRTGFTWILFDPQWDLLRLYAFHMTLLIALWTATLVKLDGWPLPKRLLAFGVTLGLVSAAFWPHLHPVGWIASRPTWLTAIPGATRFDTGLVGFALGSLWGHLLSKLIAFRGSSGPSLAAAFGLVGLFLGWQAIIGVTAVLAIIGWLWALVAQLWPRAAQLPVLGHVLAATLLYLCCWKQLSVSSWLPGATASLPAFLAWALLSAALLATSVRWLQSVTYPDPKALTSLATGGPV